MKTKRFGNTSLEISVIGLGLAALGRPGYINLGHGHDLRNNYDPAVMQANANAVLDTAYKLGIRYFDVARSYGKGEEFLGNWLQNGTVKHGVVAGSKWGYTYTADWEVEAKKHEIKEHSAEVFNRQWPVSKRNLGERLKIYHIHSATPESGVLENEEVLGNLWELKHAGITPGLSLSGENQSATLKKALTIKRGGELLFQSVQATWNILEQSAGEALKEAADKGMGVIIKEALANGRLTERNKHPGFAGKLEVLKALAQKYNAGIDALSIAFVLHQPWVSTVLSGASIPEQIQSNVKAQELNISEEDLNLLRSLAESKKEYWKIRSQLAWN